MSAFEIGLAIGGLAAVTYTIIALCNKTEPNLGKIVALFLAGAGAVSGVKLCHFSATSTVLATMPEDRLYIFIGGIAVIYVSLTEMVKVVRAAGKP